MNEIKLNKLSLRDFQGGTFTLDAGGQDLFIFAANAGGKTRLVSAFTWLLFNKDALGRSDFEIKSLDAQGEAAHGLEHSVEAELEVNGEIETLKKVYKEKWTKKRGNAEREFSGHTVEYFVNGVPLQEKLFNQHIIDIAGDESRFRLLTSPTTFPQLHWQKQRALLLEVCGDISDADVIDSNPKLASLPAILGKRSLDDHRKVVTARRTEINKEMERIPIRIDEVHRSLPDITGIDRIEAEKEAHRLETSLNAKKLELQGVNTGGNIADLSKRLSGLNADLRKMEDGHRSGSMATLNRLNQQISEVDAHVNALRRRIGAYDGDLKQKEGQVQSLDSDLSRLRNQWTAIDAEIFKDTTTDTCPACGQSLPGERVQEARGKALASFNEKKAERLGDIDRKGKNAKEQRTRLHGQIDALKKEQEIAALSLPETEANLATLTNDRDTLKRSSEDFSGIDGRAEILDEIEDVEGQIKAERDGKAQDVEKIKGEIENLSHDLCLEKAKVDAFTRREQGESRINQLKAEEKVLAMEFEKLEGQLYLCDLFVKTKVELLSDKVNSKFEFTRFRLFNTLINGGIDPTCEITVNGIGYNSGLNSAARTQSGMDIVRTLQRHYGIAPVIWVDNREGCSEIPSMDCQVISLYVSPQDKQLRIEVQEKERKAA